MSERGTVLYAIL